MTDPGPGLAVDSAGRPVVDPTKNVLDLVAAEARRQDDLRMAAERRQDDLRAEAERLSSVKHQHSREVIEIHAAHAKELREAETKRLDAIREVDVSAASLIASQVSNTAEALRVLVSTTAETLARQTTTTTDQLSGRIAQLERSSYEGTGKSAVADPMIARMTETLEALKGNMAEDQGGKASRGESRAGTTLRAILVGVALSFLMLAAVIIIAVLRGTG